MAELEDKLSRLSNAVSLTVLEIDFYPNELIPAFLLANLMSPALWAWRSEKNAYNNEGLLLSPKSRLNQIQRFFHRYTFTNIPDEPGGDPWGLLSFHQEEKRFGPDFISKIREEYDATFRQLLVENSESQFGQIINQPYYKDGFFPRLKNETLEVMNAFANVNAEGKRSGAIVELARQYPDSVYEFALYAFRSLAVSHPQVYVHAALRDYHVGKLAEGVEELSDALEIVAGLAGSQSIFESRDRIAMPDETLYFRTGSDRDKALLLYTLLQHSIIVDRESVIGFSEESSFVSHHGQWIDLATLSFASKDLDRYLEEVSTGSGSDLVLFMARGDGVTRSLPLPVLTSSK